MEFLHLTLLFKNGVERVHKIDLEEEAQATMEIKEQAMDGFLKLFSEVETLRFNSAPGHRVHIQTNEIAHAEIKVVSTVPSSKNGPRVKPGT